MAQPSGEVGVREANLPNRIVDSGLAGSRETQAAQAQWHCFRPISPWRTTDGRVIARRHQAHRLDLPSLEKAVFK